MQAAFAARCLLPERADAGGPDRFHQIQAWNAQREQGARVHDGWLQSAKALHAYPQASERQRFARTEEIIQRSRPGPHEVVPLYPGLARQAATLEMVMAEHLSGSGGAAASIAAAAQKGGPGLSAFHPVVVLGTLPLALHRSRPLVLQSPDHAELLLSLSFADACYQLIKLAVQAWALVHDGAPAGQRQGVGFNCRPQAIAAQLDAQPALVQAMQALLQGYCEHGVPRVAAGAPALPYQVALELLVAWADRFSLGLGYAALGLLRPRPPGDAMPAADAPPDPVADAQAATAVMVSAAEIDRQHAAQALQGCLFSVNADAVLGWALACCRAVRHPDRDTASTTITARLAQRQRAVCDAFVALARAHGVAEDDAQAQAP